MTQSQAARRRFGARLRVRARRLLSPARLALALLIAGDSLAVYGISLVAVPAAWIFAGASIVAYALLFVDVDGTPRRRG